jgi:hypothetical protein
MLIFEESYGHRKVVLFAAISAESDALPLSTDWRLADRCAGFDQNLGDISRRGCRP